MTDPRLHALPRDPERTHVSVPGRMPTPAVDRHHFDRQAAAEWLGELLRGAAVEHQGQGTRVDGRLLPISTVAAYLEEDEPGVLNFWVQIDGHTFQVDVQPLG